MYIFFLIQLEIELFFHFPDSLLLLYKNSLLIFKTNLFFSILEYILFVSIIQTTLH